MVVYVEQVLLANFMADGILLWAAGRLWGRPVPPVRWLTAAALSALAALIPWLVPLNLMATAGFLALVTALVTQICWRSSPAEGLRLWGTLWAATWLAAGAAGALRSVLGAVPGLLCAGGGMAAVLLTARLALPGWRREGRACLLRIRRGRGRDYSAWLDTGNALTEPLSGLPVIVVSQRAMAALCDTAAPARLIPCRSAGGSTVMESRKVEDLEVYIDRRWCGCGPVYLACAGQRLPYGVEALVPPLPWARTEGSSLWRRFAG